MPSLTVQIKRFFQEGLEKSKANVKISVQNVFLVLALALIFIVALVIRLAPLFNGVTMIKAFDPWVQYRCTQYIVDNGLWEFLNWRDYQSWYPEGNLLGAYFPGLLVTNAVFYWILSGLGFPVTVYDVVFHSGAFMGATTCIVMFFLGKEILDKRMGLIASFFLALSPGYMQRTVAGFYDNETVGIFAVLMTLLFFIRALKKGSIIDGLIGGFSLGYLTLSWGGYIYITLLIPLASALMILFKKYSTRLLLAYTTVIGTALVIHTFFRRVTPTTFLKDAGLAIPLLFLFVLPVVEYLYRKKEYNPAWYRNFWKIVKKSILPGIVVAGVALWLVIQIGGFEAFVLNSRQMTILNPLFRDQIALVASVGEHMPSAWAVFYFNTLVPLIFVVPGIFFAYKRGNESDIILIVFTLTLYYFTGSMIRVILLFAPAAALMGAYGLSQILKSFGAISRKQARVQRRRRREAKQMLDRSTGAVLFIFVGGLFLAQTIHATDVAATQLPWSEIVAGGQFHDWEETFSWMRTNLNAGTVVVSWWDYGYWITTNGNVTSVNDNGTLNATRIGQVGMALMNNDELEAARILRMLGAEYVLIYFGHLVSGIGGDEGKWPWMVKICNDHSTAYANASRFPGLQTQNWYRSPQQYPDNPQVFNYADYINETSGAYRPAWFNSQLVRMMFYQEPLDPNSATTQLNWWTAREIAGDGSSKEPRTDDNGRTWKSYFEDPEYFNFKVFRKAFFSGNTTVKVFKVDYTAIESDFTIDGINLYDNGFGNVLVNNTGSKDLNVTKVRFRDASTFYDAFSLEGTNIVEPGAAKWFWFNTNFTGANKMGVGDAKNMLVTARAEAIEQTYAFERTISTTVKNATVHANISVSINRARSAGRVPNLVDVEVQNTGSVPVNVKEITVGQSKFNRTKIVPLNDSYAIPAGEARAYRVTLNSSHVVGNVVDVSVAMVEGARDGVVVTFQGGDARIAFDTRYTALPESTLIRDNAFLLNYSLVNFSKPEMSPVRSYMPVNLSSSVAFTNGTMVLRVKNTGSTVLDLDELKINGSTYNGWVIQGGLSHSMHPGDVRTIRVGHDALALDAVQVVVVIATDQLTGAPAAVDFARLKTVAPGEAVRILTRNTFTFAFTNETVDVLVKNVGTESTTIGTLWINGTQVAVTDGMVTLGTRTLGFQESCVIRYNFTAAAIANFNATSSAHLRVRSVGLKESEVTITTTVNPLTKMNVTTTAKTNGEVTARFHNIGTAGLHANLTVAMVRIEAKGEVRYYVPQEVGQLVTLGTSSLLGFAGSNYFVWTATGLAIGDTVSVTLYSAEGGEFTRTVSVVAA